MFAAITWDSVLSSCNGAGAWLVVWSLFIIGLLGTLVPILPGIPLIWCGILVDKLWMGADSVSWTFVLVTGAITVLAQVVDYYLSYWGVKRFGGTWRGGVGGIIGLVVGIFLPPPLFWIIFAPIIGAVAGELLGGSSLREAGKAGAGTIVGGIVAFVLKIFIGIAMIVAFLFMR